MRALIVEGPDGVGKTPFVREFCAIRPDWDPLKLVRNPLDSAREEKIANVRREIKRWEGKGGRPIIYDRFSVPSEWIYAPLCGGREREREREEGSPTGDLMKLKGEVEAAATSMGVMFLFIMPHNLEEYLKGGARIDSAHMVGGAKEDPLTICLRYERAYRELAVPKARLSSGWFDSGSVGKILEKLGI